MIFKEAGIEITEVNIPSATCHETIPFNQGNRRHTRESLDALTGTNPLHAKMDLPPKTSNGIWSVRVSHNLDGPGPIFCGGGYYRRGHFRSALIGYFAHSLVRDVLNPFSDERILITIFQLKRNTR